MRTSLLSILFATISFAALFAQSDSVEYQNNKFTEKLFFQTSFGIMIHEKLNGIKAYAAAFDGTVAYKFNNLFHGGVSVGYEEYDQFSAIPISLYMGGDLMRSGNTPIYYTKIGYSYFLKEAQSPYETINNGRNYEVGLGYAWTFDQLRVKLCAGWKRQKLQTEVGNSYPEYTIRLAAPTLVRTSWRMDRFVGRLIFEF